MQKSVTLGNCFSNLIHKPRTSSGYALYTRVKNADSNDEYNDTVRQAELDNEYKSKSQIIYNSPENIRRVFLTGAGAAIHYYFAPYNNGKEAAAASYTAMDLKIDGVTNLLDVAERLANYQTEHSHYVMQKNLDKSAKEPNYYRVSGVFNFATHPYTLNNVEEIYFDWTLLLSWDLLGSFQKVIPGFNGSSSEDLAQYMLSSNGTTCIKCDELIKVFEYYNLSGAKDIAKRFPRLKKIALISNLANVDSETLKRNSQLHTNGNISVDEIKGTWLDAHKEELMSMGPCLILEASIPRQSQTEFITKPSTYRYDAEILDPKVKSFKTALDDLMRQQRYGTAQSTTSAEEDIPEPTVQSEVETFLESLYSRDSKLAMNVLKVTYKYGTANKADWKDVLRGFSKKNRQKYAEALNITF